MITIIGVFLIFLVIGFIIAFITGIMAILPPILLILGLISLDVCLFKLIFKKKGDHQKGE